MRGKLSVGDALGEVFDLYRQHAGVLLPLAFWLFLAVAIVEGVIGPSVGAFLVGMVLTLLVGTLYQGVVVNLVGGVHAGSREFSIRGLLDTALPYLPRLIAAGILASAAMAVGFVLLIVPGLYLATIWAVLAPAIVIEDCGVFGSFGRSRELVRGNGWPVLGAIAVAFVIAAAVGLILLEIVQAVAGGPLLEIVFGAIAATVTAPIAALVASVLYYRLLVIERVAEPPPPSAPPPSVVE
ncbi:MAG: hypothetical protein R2725_15705 [Solirubrobacterales bacterium]